MARKKLKSKLQENYLLIIGILLISIFSMWRYHQARILSFNSKEISRVNSSGIKPMHIKSYPVGVDIDVKETVINDGVWAINPNYASYLISSAGISGNGNIIIYGHNKDKIMGPIRWIKKDAIIEILGSDNKTYKYKVVKTDVVSPDDLNYIKPTDKETLTLYTCTGFLDSKRFIVVAEPSI